MSSLQHSKADSASNPNPNAPIAQVNDAFRRHVLCKPHPRGKAFLTSGVNALDAETKNRALHGVRDYTNFEEASDPYGEHDFGAFVVDGQEVFWKIDYYADSACVYGTEDIRNAYRRLTIMLASEY